MKTNYTDDDLETLIPGLRVSKETKKTWEMLLFLIGIMFGGAVVFAVIGAWEFAYCRTDHPDVDVTFRGCMAHDYGPPIKRKK